MIRLLVLMIGLSFGSTLGADLENGFYLVAWKGADAKDAPALEGNQRLLEYEYLFLEPSSDRPNDWVVVDTDHMAPIELAKDPKSIPRPQDRIMLELELTKDAASDVERLTRGNVGRQAAIIIGDKVITTHTIRAEIKGGVMQISRCADDACRYILAKLKE